MILRPNIMSAFLSSDKIVSTYVPFAGSAALHVTLFAAIFGFFGTGTDQAPSPQVVAIELVQASELSESKGVKTITDKKGSVSQKKQTEKTKPQTKIAALSTAEPALEKTKLSPKKTKAKSPQKKIQKKKLASRSAPGSHQQMKGSARKLTSHGPKFSGKGLSNPRPRYPHDARSKGQEGRVVLKVNVSSAGRALNVRVSRTSGVRALDSSALRAVKRWRFHPARKNGRAVAGIVYTPITFRLVN